MYKCMVFDDGDCVWAGRLGTIVDSLTSLWSQDDSLEFVEEDMDQSIIYSESESVVLQ